MIRWPGKVKPGEVSNEMFSGLDWFPTLLAAAGDTGVKNKLLKGWAPTSGGTNFKVHLDGYNQLPYPTGQSPKSERQAFDYFNDDGMLVSMRFGNWKAVFAEQRAPGGFAVWSNPFTPLRVPKIFNLRMDPYERADVVSDQYYDWTTGISAFFAGLALGGLLFGRWADRLQQPVLLYAGLEVLVAVLGVGATFAMSLAASPFAWLEQQVGLLAWVLPFMLVGIPALLMGGTLPVLVRSLAANPLQLSKAGGQLYAANTAGAIAGTLLAAFVLIAPSVYAAVPWPRPC